MVLAAAAAMIIGSFEEAGLLILIFAGAHFLEDYAEGKSKREITNLLKLNPTEARRISTDNSVEVVSVDQLVVGDKVQVLNGGQVPTDGKIISGTTSIDESSINGESIPKEKQWVTMYSEVQLMVPVHLLWKFQKIVVILYLQKY